LSPVEQAEAGLAAALAKVDKTRRHLAEAEDVAAQAAVELEAVRVVSNALAVTPDPAAADGGAPPMGA
jgi:hypothetical protein